MSVKSRSSRLPGMDLLMFSHTAQVAPARRAVERFVRERGLEELADDVGLCVNEALANIIRHAYGGEGGRPIHLRAQLTADAVRITIRDWGCGVNPLEQPRPEPRPEEPGGVGLICLRQLMDEVCFTRTDDGMLLTLVRRRGRDG